MADTIPFQRRYWTREEYCDMQAVSRLFHVYMLTSQHTNNIGYFECSKRLIEVETGLKPEAQKAALKDLAKNGFIVGGDGNGYLVVDFIRENFTAKYHKSPNSVKNWQTLFAELHNENMENALLNKYPHIFVTDDGPPS